MMPETGGVPTYRVGGTGVAWRETAGEIVVLDLAASVYFGLNPAATALWTAMVAGATRAELVGVVSRLGADDSRAGADVDAFLGALDASGLLATS